MRTKIITAVTFVLGTATFASAAPAPADPAADAMVAKIMKHIDADKDGRISRAEAVGREKLSKNFDRIDADHDGFLSHDELLVVVEKRLAKQKAEAGF
jgi:Ca2+-binding EF-hand superfamily protein